MPLHLARDELLSYKHVRAFTYVHQPRPATRWRNRLGHSPEHLRTLARRYSCTGTCDHGANSTNRVSSLVNLGGVNLQQQCTTYRKRCNVSQSFGRLRRGISDRSQGVCTCSRQYLSLNRALRYVRRSGAHAEFRTPRITCTRSVGATCPHSFVKTCPGMTLATALVGQH